MHCPVDGTQLVMTERSGVEIDYCPACRGVWLDRGELDKIIERSASASATPPPPPTRPARDGYHPSGSHDHGHKPGRGYDRGYDRDYERGGKYRKKKKSAVSDILGDIFDF